MAKKMLEVSPDGKQEVVEGAEPLKKLPIKLKPANPKDPILNPDKFPPKALSDKKQADYAKRALSTIKKDEDEEEEHEIVDKRWKKLKKGLNNLESIMDLAEASQPDEAPPQQEEPAMDPEGAAEEVAAAQGDEEQQPQEADASDESQEAPALEDQEAA